ncbi:hypothetical protein Cpir12675_001235 [Ceratocystis pirilliformis]|uniref:CTD kinase subunit gamma n=1 Tax=Ceratocystis pirilliformis TaxID=259994 RepID=A0ABR3ZGB5_9PEZI
MADPFEVRVRFIQILTNLSASSTASQKAAQFLVKNRSMSEDLHSCIIEQVENLNNMNVRANIMCFIEVFMDMATKETLRDSCKDYLTMMRRDLVQIVQYVAPCDALGHVNLTLTKLVVQNLERKGHITNEIHTELQDWFSKHDALLQHTDPLDLPVADKKTGFAPASKSKADPANVRLTRRQIEQRIEEDRERHKRLREDIWAMPNGPNDKPEWVRIWEETSDLGEDDYCLAREEADERRGVLGGYCKHWQERIAEWKEGIATGT